MSEASNNKETQDSYTRVAKITDSPYLAPQASKPRFQPHPLMHPQETFLESTNPNKRSRHPSSSGKKQAKKKANKGKISPLPVDITVATRSKTAH